MIQTVKIAINKITAKYLFILIYFFFAFSISKSEEVLKLEEAISIGLKNNYDIQLSKNDALISKENNTSGNAGMLPNVNLNAGLNYALNNSHLEYSTGIISDKPSASVRSYSAALTINWTIFDGFRMFTTKSKLEEIEKAGEIKYRAQLQLAISQIANAYFDIVKQKQILNGIIEIKALSGERLKISETRFNAGLSAKTEYLQAQIDFNTQSQNEYLQQNVIAESKRKLNQILAREIALPYEVIDAFDFSSIDSASAESKILNSNPALLLLSKQAEISKLAAREIESLNFPFLNFYAGYGLNLADNSTGLVLFNRSYGPNAGLTLSYPMFQGGNISRQIQVAEITSSSAEIQLKAAKNQISTQFLNALNILRTNQKMLEIENLTKNLAKENLLLAIERLKLSQTTAIEVRDAQVSYENSLTRLSNISYNLKLAETQIKLLMGQL